MVNPHYTVCFAPELLQRFSFEAEFRGYCGNRTVVGRVWQSVKTPDVILSRSPAQTERRT